MNPIEIALPWFPVKNADAITLWPFIFYRQGTQNDVALRCHEFFHWRQANHCLVIPWYLAYVLLLPFYFRQSPEHPLEAQAYALQWEVRRLLAAGESVDEHLTKLGVPKRD